MLATRDGKWQPIRGSKWQPIDERDTVQTMARATATSERPKLMTLEEWADLDDEIEGELVDGILEQEEMPSVLHEIIVGWMFAALRPWARRRGGFVVGSETKLAVDEAERAQTPRPRRRR